MKKGILIFIAVFVLVLGLCGCSSSSSSSSETSSSDPEAKESNNEPQDLILKDYGYIINNGYVMYAVEIENPNTDWGADYANIVVTGKHKDGTIAFSDDWTIGNIMPGSDTYWASQAGDGDTVKSDDISIELTVDENNWQKTDEIIPENLYTFDNVTVKKDTFDYLTAKGEITLTQDFAIGSTDAFGPMYVCILKDDKGKIITGFNGYANSDLKVGKATVFDISSSFNVKYKKAEMHANMWM